MIAVSLAAFLLFIAASPVQGGDRTTGPMSHGALVGAWRGHWAAGSSCSVAPGRTASSGSSAPRPVTSRRWRARWIWSACVTVEPESRSALEATADDACIRRDGHRPRGLDPGPHGRGSFRHE
jgi:hypothetical protein